MHPSRIWKSQATGCMHYTFPLRNNAGWKICRKPFWGVKMVISACALCNLKRSKSNCITFTKKRRKSKQAISAISSHLVHRETNAKVFNAQMLLFTSAMLHQGNQHRALVIIIWVLRIIRVINLKEELRVAGEGWVVTASTRSAFVPSTKHRRLSETHFWERKQHISKYMKFNNCSSNQHKTIH